MSDVKSLFRKKKKADGKPKTEASKRATQEAAEDDDWGVAPQQTEVLYTGNRTATELIGGAYQDVNLATKVAHEDTKQSFHEVRKKAVLGSAGGSSGSTSEEAHKAEAQESKPVEAPSAGRGAGLWRSSRLAAQQQAAAEGRPPPGQDYKQKVEEFPALAPTGPAPVVAGGKVKGGSAWGRIGAGAAEEEEKQPEQQPQQQEAAEEQQPPPQETPVAIEKLAQAVEEKVKVVEEKEPAAAPVAAPEPPPPPPAPEAESDISSSGGAAEGGGEEEEENAVTDLKSKFGTKKKKKKLVIE